MPGNDAFLRCGNEGSCGIGEAIDGREQDDRIHLIGVVDIARYARASFHPGGAGVLATLYPKHWSYVHGVQWGKLHWAKTELV